jgi:transcriptional regulator with XRE-family HTH domain
MKNEITSKRLIQALEQCNMKAQELANKSGVSKNSISQYVNGTHAPSNISAGKMAKVLSVNPVWLMGFDVPMHEPEAVGQYYLDEKTAQIAQEIFDDPHKRALFDASRKATPEALDLVAKMLEELNK